jgi:aspartyl-tRNA synthetase
MKRSLALESNKSIDQQVMLMGWVNSRRDHGGVIFIDIRDESGIVQLTIHPDHEAAFRVAETVRDEYVLKATGKVINRESGLINKDIATGEVEVVVEMLEILNKSDPLPFSVTKDNQVANEETRLKYRYLDLRREKMQTMLKRRSEMYSYIRQYMEKKRFYRDYNSNFGKFQSRRSARLCNSITLSAR